MKNTRKTILLILISVLIFSIISSSLSAKSFRLFLPDNKFSPNADGIEDEIKIYIYLREDALITLKIKNYEDKLINTLAENFLLYYRGKMENFMKIFGCQQLTLSRIGY